MSVLLYAELSWQVYYDDELKVTGAIESLFKHLFKVEHAEVTLELPHPIRRALVRTPLPVGGVESWVKKSTPVQIGGSHALTLCITYAHSYPMLYIPTQTLRNYSIECSTPMEVCT